MTENDYSLFTPKTIEQFKGQNNNIVLIKNALKVAKDNGSCIDHVLLVGNPGLGKTTLARIIGNELKSNFIYVSAPSLSSTIELISIVSSVKANDVLFIDEIHRISTKLEEVLYTVMEDYKLAFVFNNEENSKPIEIDLPKFTLIGATTKPYKLSTPLRNRFPIYVKLEDYDQDNMVKLTKLILNHLKLKIDEESVSLLANSSRKNPRILKNNIKRLYDYCFVNKIEEVKRRNIKDFLRISKIYDDGLDTIDIKILISLYNDFKCKPVSMESVALMIGEPKEDIMSLHEPFLLENSYILRTRKGRVLSEKGSKYLLDNKLVI